MDFGLIIGQHWGAFWRLKSSIFSISVEIGPYAFRSINTILISWSHLSISTQKASQRISKIHENHRCLANVAPGVVQRAPGCIVWRHLGTKRYPKGSLMIPKGALWSPRGDPNGIPRGEMGHSGAFLDAFRLMFKPCLLLGKVLVSFCSCFLIILFL